jgi:hypothetical protein
MRRSRPEQLTPERILEIARQFSAYEPDAKIVALRSDEAIVEFARELCREYEAECIGKLWSQLDEHEARMHCTYTPPGTYGAPAAPAAPTGPRCAWPFPAGEARDEGR